MKYKYKARCSQCGLGFRSNSRSDLLGRLRKHLWSKHKDWMKSRIRAGLRRAKRQAKAVNPDLLGFLRGVVNPRWVGFVERPIIEKATGLPYEEVKSKVLDFMVQTMLGGLTIGRKQ